MDEVNDLAKQNKDKIKELKKKDVKIEKMVFDKKSEIKIKEVENVSLEDKFSNDRVVLDGDNKNSVDNCLVDKDVSLDEVKRRDNSYINLGLERKRIISECWQKIDILKLDEYILRGKDILARNYTVTYGDEALSFIYEIRDEYSILIEYFIGFNNEKKGIFNKCLFSEKLEDEWRFLASYIKLLEKIRGVKK